VASLVGASLLVALVAMPSVWAFRQTTAAAEARKQAFVMTDRAKNLMADLIDAETGQRGFLLTGDETFLEPYLAVRGTLSDQAQQLRHISQLAATAPHLDALPGLIEEKLAYLGRNIALRRNNDLPAALANVQSPQDKQLMDSIRAEVGAVIGLEQVALEQRETAFQATMRRLFSIIVGASLVMLLVALGFAYSIHQNSRRQLGNLLHLKTRELLDVQEHTNALLQHANLTLRLSEEKIAVTLDSIGDAVLATDANACVTSLNPVAEHLTGWTQAEALGRPVCEVLHIFNKESRQAATIPVMAALAHGTIQGLANHTVLIARDGSECDIADSCAPIRDRDGEVVGAVLVFRDVTEDYAVQQALRDSSALVQTILSTVVDGIITLHAASGKIETVNPATERMFGYGAAELRGQAISLLIPELIDDQHLNALKPAATRAAALGNQLGRDLVGRRKDGTTFPLEIAAGEMNLGGQRYFTGVLRDLTARKQIDAALLKAGALQSAIFNSANFSSIATDAKGVIQIFNVGAERMLGYAAADVMNRISPADISDPQELIARASALSTELGTPITPGFEALVFKASRGIEDIYELTYIRKDGSRFPAVVSVTALRDDQKDIIGYLLIGTDNTIRKQVEAERQHLLETQAETNSQLKQANRTLQISEEKFAVTLNSIGDAVIATDAEARVTLLNPLAEQLTGWTQAEATGLAVDEIFRIVNKETRQPAAIPVVETLARGTIQGLANHTVLIARHGSECDIADSCAPIRDRDGQVIGAVLVFRDVTGEYAVQRALRDQQFYTRSLIESNIDAIMTTDPSGSITDVNNQMEVLTGRSRDELIGAPFKNYVTAPGQAEAAITRVLQEGKVTDFELTARAADGKETVVSYNATTFHDQGGVLQGVFFAARDVTERKRVDTVLQENTLELEKAKAIAEKANQAKSDFLSSMSHELRSPLNAILGFAQLMDSDTPPPSPSQKGSIDQILHAGWYLLELINEILDLAVVESGRLALSLEAVSLSDVMLECQAMIEPQAQKRGIRMTFPSFTHSCYIKADHTRVKQVLINLLSNAIKYNQAGGSVGVDCILSDPDRVRISVQDTGAGLSSENLAQLFQPFNRLGQESGGEEGTGIGLVVSKRLVELMHGQIGVTSSVGAGSVFWIELAATTDPHAAYIKAACATLAVAPLTDGLRSHLLLYVEDNPANLRLIEQLIARRPEMRLLTAQNGNDGINLARASLPDVILMDINLPGISGIEAMQILRLDPLTAHIPIVALSANAIPRDIAKGLEAGFFRYLTKPIKVNQFMDTMNEVMEFADRGTSVEEPAAPPA